VTNRRRAQSSLLAAGIALTATLLTAPARAQLLPTAPLLPYLGGEGGWTVLDSVKDTVPGKSFPQTWKSGGNAGMRLGLASGPWRFEAEFRYQDNDANTCARHSVHGGRQGYALLTNAIYDVALGWPVTPHIGAGIGAVDIDEHVTAPILGLGLVTSGSKWQFAYQAIAGLRYEISPPLALDIDYRYLGATTPHFRTPAGLIVDGAPAGNLTVTSGFTSQSLIASLRWRFGAVP